MTMLIMTTYVDDNADNGDNHDNHDSDDNDVSNTLRCPSLYYINTESTSEIKAYYIHNRGVHTVLKDTYSSNNIRTTAMHAVLKDA